MRCQRRACHGRRAARARGRIGRGALVLLVGAALAATAIWLRWEPAVDPLPATALPLAAEASVVAVEDGDTFVAAVPGHGRLRVRLHAIDTPERVQPYGDRAGDALRALVEDRRVELDCYKLDPRGRAVCRVALKRGSERLDVQRELVGRGLAWHFRAFEREQTAAERRALQEAEAQARSARRGLWLQDDPMPPWVCRERLRGGESCR